MSWAYESNEGFVPQRKRTGHRTLFRLWREPHHRYTLDRGEYLRLRSEGYALEGSIAYLATRQRGGNRPLHWLEHPRTGDTFFTVSESERRSMLRRGYVNLGVAGYVASKRGPGFQPFYRAYDPGRHDHLYSRDVSEVDAYGPTLSSEELSGLIKGGLGRCLDPEGDPFYLADERYYCPSEAVVREIMAAAKVNRRRYIEEVFDCDDFAHLLKSKFIESIYDSGRRSLPYAMGIVWGSRPPHAMNFVVLSNGNDYRLKIIEPQQSTLHNPALRLLSGIYLVLG